MPKDDDVNAAIGQLAESPPPANEAPEPPGPSPNGKIPIERPKPRRNVGIGAEPPQDKDDPNAPFPHDATDAANEIVRRTEKFKDLGDPRGIDIHIIPKDGSSPRLLGKVGFGDLIHPEICAGEMLRAIVTDRFHRQYAKIATSYECNFHWRRSGMWLTKGTTLYLGAPSEIDRLSGVGQPNDPPPPDPYNRFPQRPYAPPPQQSYGSPPQAPASAGVSPEMNVLLDRMSRTEGALGEVMLFLREERAALRAQAGLPPAPAPAPASPSPTAPPVPAPGLGGLEDLVARGVVAGLKAAGVAAVGGVPPVPTPPNQPPAKDPIVSEIEGVIVGALREGVRGLGKTLQENFRTAIAGVGAPPAPAPEPIEPPEPEPAEPIPPAPFHVTDTGSKWSDGRPVVYAQDAEGNMDLKGILFSNPVLIEKGVLGTAEKLADGFKDLMSKVTLPNGTEVVSKTPRGAVDGTPRPGAQPAQGVGQPPQSPNAPPPPPPSPNRKPGGGFPEG